MKEHRVAAVAALATGLGTALTGFFPSFVPVILTTLLMSFGFHFFEAVNQSLLLQYFDVHTTPVVMGKLRGLAAGGSLAASVFVFFCSDFLPYTMMFLIVGALCMFTGVWGLFLDPTNKELPIQSKKMVFRRKYWLFYLLTLFLGARRQIFIVFALFLLVEHFRFSVNTVSVLFMINYAINWFLNPLIGRTINRIGERKLLSIEYSTAILVFTGLRHHGQRVGRGRALRHRLHRVQFLHRPAYFLPEDSRTAGHRPDHGRGSDHQPYRRHFRARARRLAVGGVRLPNPVLHWCGAFRLLAPARADHRQRNKAARARQGLMHHKEHVKESPYSSPQEALVCTPISARWLWASPCCCPPSPPSPLTLRPKPTPPSPTSPRASPNAIRRWPWNTKATTASAPGLATRVKETLNSSNLFSLTDKDTPKIRILIATQPEFKDRPGVGSAYAVVWVFSQSENILRHYLTREVGVVTPDEINGLAAKLVEETDSLATRYGYLFQ